MHPQPNMSCVRPAMSPLRSGPMKRTAKFFFVFLRWIDRRGVERHAGARSSAGSVSGNASREGLVSGPVSRPRGVAKARERKRGEETDGATFDPFSRFDVSGGRRFARKKGHVASFAPFATNVLSSMILTTTKRMRTCGRVKAIRTYLGFFCSEDGVPPSP